MFSIGKLLFWVGLLHAHESENLYRLDVKTNRCLAVADARNSRAPVKLTEFPHLDPDFLEKNPLCKNAVTCLNYGRLQNLFVNGAIPSGINSNHYLTGEFKKRLERVCLQSDSTQPFSNLHELVDHLSGKRKVYPIETRMSFDVVKKTKTTVDDYLKTSAADTELLKQCLRIDVELDKRTGDATEKIEAYHKLIAQDTNTAKGCEVLWGPKSEIRNLRNNLANMRMALFSLKALRSGAVLHEGDLKIAANHIQNRFPLAPGLSGALDGPLTPNDGMVMNLAKGAFWNQTPSKLAPLSSTEKDGLGTYLADLRKRYPADKIPKIEDALMTDYFNILSESPILAQFPSASARPSEVLRAFESYQKNSLTAKRLSMSDIDYLKFSKAFEHTLIGEKPEVRGDLCVLSEYMLRSRTEFFDAPLNLLYGVMLVEGGFAILAARGLLPKLMALLMGAQFSGTAVAVLQLEKTMRIYEQQKATCSTTAVNSDGLCNVNKLNENFAQSSVSAAMALVFSVPKKALAVVALPTGAGLAN